MADNLDRSQMQANSMGFTSNFVTSTQSKMNSVVETTSDDTVFDTDQEVAAIAAKTKLV